MRQNDKNKGHSLFVRISAQENKMVQDLRKHHSTNVSQLVRNSIKDYYLCYNSPSILSDLDFPSFEIICLVNPYLFSSSLYSL